MSAAEEIFDKTYDKNLWGNADSRSGPGSDLSQTRIIRDAIPGLVEQYNIKTMVDAPCGDFFWMKEIIGRLTTSLESYTGVDIVARVIEKNTTDFGSNKVKFLQRDISETPVPKADLVLTRDCFIHLSYRKIYAVLANHKKSGSKYVLIGTYNAPDRVNKNCDDFYLNGRVLNFEKKPFSFSKPLVTINEGCTEGNGAYSDKSLALWEINKLPLWKLQWHLRYLYLLSVPGRAFRKLKKIISGK